MTKKNDKGEKIEEGMLGQTICPDCLRPLVEICKIIEKGVTPVRAKICMNKFCWRFTQLAYLMTWKKR